MLKSVGSKDRQTLLDALLRDGSRFSLRGARGRGLPLAWNLLCTRQGALGGTRQGALGPCRVHPRNFFRESPNMYLKETIRGRPAGVSGGLGGNDSHSRILQI